MKDTAEKIGLSVAVVIGINAMIGAGIVAIPAFLSRQVGPAGVFSFAFSIFVVLCMSLSLAKLADRFPGDGWSYRYPQIWGGHKWGLFSASSYLIGVMIAMGFLVQQAGVWAQNFFPNMSAITIGGGVLIILTGLVLAGAEASSWSQYVIAAIVVSALLVTVGICASQFDAANLTPFLPGGIRSVFAAAPKAMFTLLGFESIASLYSIVRKPEKNIPIAGVLAVVFVGSLYLLFSGSILSAIPGENFVNGSDETLTTVINRVFPQFEFLSFLLLLGGLFAIIGTLHSMIWSCAVLLTDVLKKVQTPTVVNLLETGKWNATVSVLVTATVMLLSALFLHSELILDLSVCLIAITYISAMSLLFFYREFWASGRNILTLLAMLGGVTLIYFSLQPWLF
ncbi:MAG: amino acid permease [Deltaproteobacteria bacterium]|nr:amino acid permease [Deltaproteobacteria bacterium]